MRSCKTLLLSLLALIMLCGFALAVRRLFHVYGLGFPHPAL